MKCTRCGSENPDTADYCGNCGWTLHSQWKGGNTSTVRRKKPSAVRMVVAGLVAIILFGMLYNLLTKGSATAILTPSQSRTLADAYAYLKEQPDVAWVETQDNNVYIGFRSKPEDLSTVVRAAAFVGRSAVNETVHVWAVDGTQLHWRPSNGNGTYWLCGTAHQDGTYHE